MSFRNSTVNVLCRTLLRLTLALLRLPCEIRKVLCKTTFSQVSHKTHVWSSFVSYTPTVTWFQSRPSTKRLQYKWKNHDNVHRLRSHARIWCPSFSWRTGANKTKGESMKEISKLKNVQMFSLKSAISNIDLLANSPSIWATISLHFWIPSWENNLNLACLCLHRRKWTLCPFLFHVDCSLQIY